MSGKAQGEGTATYENNYLKSVRGHFDKGIVSGRVAITYSDGGSYIGGFRNGEPDGFGISKDASGAGYEGPWLAGTEHGEGLFITADARRIRAVWDHGQLVGSWYKDAKSACLIWWSGGEKPVGTLTWDGSCRNGKAYGTGNIEWIDTTSPIPAKNSVSFRGALVDGKLNGAGVWHQALTFKNVIDHETRKGKWVDGMISGPGSYVSWSEFLDGSFASAMDRYEGGFEADRYSGAGRREVLKVYTDGGLEWTVEEGEFLRGALTGQATRSSLRKMASGEQSFEQTRGRHKEREFIGFGRRMVRSNVDNGYVTSAVDYGSGVQAGGEGIISYPKGDVYKGSFDAWGAPTRGACTFKTISYVGRCEAMRTDMSNSHWRICLSPPDLPRRCLKRIGDYFS